MAKYLVVAHQTAASPELLDRLKKLRGSDVSAEFVLLVPATARRHLLAWVEGEAEQAAQQRASRATQAMREAGLLVTNTVIGDADPLKALNDELSRGGNVYSTIVISMLPAGLSRWLHRDLPHQAGRFGIPVSTVVSGRVTPAGTEMTPGAPVPEIWDTDPPTLRQLAAHFGQPVRGADGELGRMGEVLYDNISGEPLWIGMASHPLPMRTLLIPARAVRIGRDGLETRLTHRQVVDEPHVTVGEGFSSLTEEESVHRYFGLPFDRIADTRVLREGQEIPGSETNEQHILAGETPARPSRLPGTAA
jgi:hypothetical protein